MTLTYWINENDEFCQLFEATTDQECPVMLTTHSYFNLSGDGKRLVVVVGSRKAFEMAVRNDDDGQRHSGLKERLRDLVRGDGVHPESHVPQANTPARGAGNETQEND